MFITLPPLECFEMSVSLDLHNHFKDHGRLNAVGETKAKAKGQIV